MSNCNGITIPGHCIQAADDYTRAFQEIMSNGTASPDSALRVLMAMRTYLDTMCSSECLAPTLRAADCSKQPRSTKLDCKLDVLSK